MEEYPGYINGEYKKKMFLSLSGFIAADSDATSFYLVGSQGLEIVDKHTQRSVGFASFSGSFNTVWAKDSSFVFMGADDGLYFIEKPLERYQGQDLSSKLFKDSRSSTLDSDNILSIHARHRDTLLLGTVSGVEILSNEGHFSSGYLYPVTTTHVTEEGVIYYGGPFGLAHKQGPVLNDWVAPDNLMVSPFIPHNQVNDIDSVTVSGETVVGIATTSGLMFLEQRDPLVLSPTTKFFTE